MVLANLEVHQMDVKIAFLNGDLDEEIYMEKLEGSPTPRQEKKVCKLVKFVWLKTSTETMAWEIWQCYDVTWLQNQWM